VQPAAQDTDAVDEVPGRPSTTVLGGYPAQRVVRKRGDHAHVVAGAHPGAGELVHASRGRRRLRYKIVAHIRDSHCALPQTCTGKPVRTDSAAAKVTRV